MAVTDIAKDGDKVSILFIIFEQYKSYTDYYFFLNYILQCLFYAILHLKVRFSVSTSEIQVTEYLSDKEKATVPTYAA